MNVKKIVLGIATALVAFSLTACGADPRKEFVDALYSTSTSEFNAAKFDMKIKELNFNGDQGDATTKMVANQLKGVSLDGSYALDEKAETMEMEVNLNVLGKKIPLQMVGGEDKLYLSTSFISGTMDLVQAFGTASELNKSDLTKLDGKYLDILEAGRTFSAGQTANIMPFKDAFAGDSKENKKYNSELKKLVASFDKKTFKKEQDTLSHTFTKSEFIQIMEFANKTFKDDKDYKKAGLDKQMTSTINKLKKDIDKLDMKISVNTKTKKTDMNLTVGTKNTDNKENNLSLALAASMTPQKNKAQIKLPAKKNIITQEELSSILDEISAVTPPSTTSDSTDTALDYSNDSEVQARIDEQLDLLIKQIDENKISLDKATADELRKSVEGVFNAEQMKKLNDALDKALLK